MRTLFVIVICIAVMVGCQSAPAPEWRGKFELPSGVLYANIACDHEGVKVGYNLTLAAQDGHVLAESFASDLIKGETTYVLTTDGYYEVPVNRVPRFFSCLRTFEVVWP